MFESAAILHREQSQLIQDEAQGLQLSSTPSSTPKYRTHPFPQALHAKISQFPPGLLALAHNRRLSLQVINFFHIFVDWLSNHNHQVDLSSDDDGTPTSLNINDLDISTPYDSITELAHTIFGLRDLTYLERLLAVAVQAYLNWWERHVRRWSNFASEHSVEV